MVNKIALAVGLVLGIIAVVMVNLHVARIKQSQEAVKVVRVTRLLKRGAMPENNLEVVSVPEEFAAGLETAVTDKDIPLVSNRPVNTEVKVGTFLQWAHFEGGGRTSERAIMEVLVKGKRAMAIPVSYTAAVAGWLRPGDYVDVIGTFSTPDRDGNQRTSTMTIQQHTRVLAIAGSTEFAEEAIRGRTGDRRGTDSVVLEVTPREAELFTFAMSQSGSLTLTLRRPDDHAMEEIPKMNWDNFILQRMTSPGR